MVWGFVTCGPNEALVVAGGLISFNYDFRAHFFIHVACVASPAKRSTDSFESAFVLIV